ncbi:hypothetical protein J437_LFUL000363 [Ladona fulva]|uniref:Calcitonin receptor n=1 Tax=Ladona fulva TaxID=123851 RepID=A0A8K0JWJ1_LADFU|nr:hypothetical protein J437_LFUL000363 [Ladona fulva]
MVLPVWKFPYYGTMGCYQYMNSLRFKPHMKFRPMLCGEYKIPCYRSPDGKEEVLFNHTDPRMQEIVRAVLRTEEYFQKWIQCSERSIECCDRIKDVDNVEGHCPPLWDAWYCWDKPAPPDTIQKGACPDFIYTSNPPSCTHFHEKECFHNGTWRAKTNYEPCSVAPEIYNRTVFHISVLSISVIASIPALIIFFCYRKLRVMRVALHRSLILAIALRNTLTIISKSTVILPETDVKTEGVMKNNGVPCRVLAFFENTAANLVFACMLLEGIYLHRLIAAALRGQPSMTPVIVAAAVVVLVPAISWAIVMGCLHDTDCWYLDADDTGFQWINDAPRLTMLLINTLLLADIVRVLITRLRTVTTANAGKFRRTAKATVFLMPLFGIQLLLTMVRPHTKDCTTENVYYFITYATDGLQGFLVVVIYCFLNKEVQELLSRTFKNCVAKLGIQRPKRDELSGRRATLLTNLPSQLQIPEGSTKSSPIAIISIPQVAPD